MTDKRNIDTIAIHASTEHWSKSRAIAPPLETSTTYEHDEKGYQEGDFIYSRYENPNRLQLEKVLSDLEGGEACAAFSSGVAAITSVFMAVPKGGHIIIPNDLYHGSRGILENFADRWGLEWTSVDTTDLEEFGDAIQDNTKLVLLETPSNPLMLITDLMKTCHLARQKGIVTCVDNTFATPYNTNPIEFGADLVMHSTSKFLGGHSDILGGAIISATEDAFFEEIRTIQRKQGSVPSPFDCWLLCRSIRSLPARMRIHNENGMRIAQVLYEHPKVAEVNYAGLLSHLNYEVAAAQMRGFGGMISFLVDGSYDETLEVVAKSKVIRRATSLGGIESLWEHRRSSESETSTTPENLIRFSVGLEHIDDLIGDLNYSLNPKV